MPRLTDWYIGTDGHVYLRYLRADVPVSKITQTAGTATVTAEAHGLSAGDVVCIEGCQQEAYNGDQTILAVTTDTFTFAVDSDTASPATPRDKATGILCGAYLDDATVTGALTTQAGVAVTGASSLSFDYLTGSPGHYVTTLPDTLTLTEGTTYVLTITATSAAGAVLNTRLQGVAQYAGM